MRLIDADATIEYLREFRCKDCDKRKGMKNGKIRFCYEIGEAPCRACDIGDTIDYFLDEDISPTIDAIALLKEKEAKNGQWIPIESPTGVEAFGVKEMTVMNVRCSVCGSEEDVSFTGYKYCPRCGAKMEGR